jgi:hypothetical protein
MSRNKHYCDHCWHQAKQYDPELPDHVYVCCKTYGRRPCGAVITHPGITYEVRSHGLLGPLKDQVRQSIRLAREDLGARR